MAHSIPASPRWALVDIGINLTDRMYTGVYHDHKRHSPDMEDVLRRSAAAGVRGLLITAGNLRESKKVIEMCQQYNEAYKGDLECLCTVGCHPTRCGEFVKDPEGYMAALDELIAKHSVKQGGCVAAVGEIGLDYDRLFFCDKETQQLYFDRQLEMAVKHELPLFLHDRNTEGDFYDAFSRVGSKLHGGVVHSFTGTAEDMRKYVEMGLYIGVNGCSFKTEENLEVVRQIPLDRLMIETDGPWCELKKTHASSRVLAEAAARRPGGKCLSDEILGAYGSCRPDKYKAGSLVKGRQEPCGAVQVLEVLYELRKEEVGSIENLASVLLKNTQNLFPFSSAA